MAIESNDEDGKCCGITLAAPDAWELARLQRERQEKLMGKVLRQPEVVLQPAAPNAAAGGITGVIGSGTTNIEQTLAERGSRYGSFEGHALITQGLKKIMQGTANWAKLADDQREALEMIAHKIGRILNGDPNYHDSWHDIVGYTKLVADRLATGKSQ